MSETSPLEKKRLLPESFFKLPPPSSSTSNEKNTTMIQNAKLAVEILTEMIEKEDARAARKDWGLYEFVGQEEEDEKEDEEEDFNLSDSEVCSSMSSDDVLEILKETTEDFDMMKELYKKDKLLLLTYLCSALEKEA